MRPVRYLMESDIKDGVYWFRYNRGDWSPRGQCWECIRIHTSGGIRWCQRFGNFQERLDSVLGRHREDFEFIPVVEPTQ